MKITTTDAYYDHGVNACPGFVPCNRVYCHKHRLLYRECETAVRGFEGDRDVIGGMREIWEVTGDCPECMRESRRKRFLERELQTTGGTR